MILSTMTRAFAYLRVSGKGQIEGDGFPRQLEAIRKYAKSNDVRLAKVFRDEGVSGTKDLINRPSLAALIQALHGDGVKLILVEKLDRLARDLMIQESILHDLTRSGFQLVSVTEPDLCSNEPSRKLMRQMMGAFSEYEKQMIVLKLSGARARMRAKEGRCEGRKPYGHRDGEGAVLERMKHLRKAGVPYEKIAATLNLEGLKPRSGQSWYPGVVRRVLLAR
jgi:DNA invertase Pin-like site-specific DNA recombinase